MASTSSSASVTETKINTETPGTSTLAAASTPTATTTAASASTTSALSANIAKRGNRSYYYAHTGKYGKGGDPQCKGGKPKKLATEAAPKVAEPIKNVVISKYMWYDGKKVTVIVDWPEEFDSLDDSQVEIICTGSNLGEPSGHLGVQLSIYGGKHPYVLRMDDLLHPIASASFKVKAEPRHIVVKLKKAEVQSWYALKKD